MNENLDKKVELLSPAGTYECFEHAIKAGADAVYLAGNRFGARAYAGNFEKDELIRALDYAHLFGKKIFLTVNTALKNNELSGLYEYIKPFYERGLDAVIVQDIGVMRFIKDNFKDMEMHVSTQASVTDSYGVNLFKDFGADRIVLAREVLLDEIKKIKETTGADLECFIHGAMCYCYSGKCLMSSFLGGRSGNRGRCAQPCRLPYNNSYLLSMKDMYTLHILPSLIDAGIDSFKIEGRMKSADYVATVTGIYRKYIDLYYNDRSSYHVDKDDEKVLLDLYTRSGNCEGYYKNYNGRNMITVDFPGYNGAKQENDLVKKYTECDKPKIEVNARAVLKKGLNAELEIFSEELSVTAVGDEVMKANNAPIGKDVVVRQLNKTGAENFVLSNIDVEMEDDIFIPVSKLNALRRDAFNKYTMSLLQKYYRKANEPINTILFKPIDNFTEKSGKTIKAAEGYTREIIMTLSEHNEIDRIIIPSFLFAKSKKNCFETDLSFVQKIEKYSALNKEIYIKLPVVLRDISHEIYNFLKYILAFDFVKGVYVDNYEGLGFLSSINYGKDIVSDIHLYNTNDIAFSSLQSIGVTKSTLPVELNKNELKHLKMSNAEMIVYGKIPLMISAQCVKKTSNECSGKVGFYYIKDRKNVTFPVLCNCIECNNQIFNGIPVCIKKDILNNFEKNVSSYRMIFTDEDDDLISDVLSYYDNKGDFPDIDYTGGHLNRGVE